MGGQHPPTLRWVPIRGGSVSPVCPLSPMSPCQCHRFLGDNFILSLFPAKHPLILGTSKVSFSSFQLGWFCFLGFFFHFFPFSQCFYHLGEKRNNSRCSAPAFPCRGGGPRGPRMLLVLCREFGATSAQGWHCPGPRGRRCRTGDSLMSWKVVLGSSPALPLSPKGDRSPASTNRSQQTRGSRWIPGLGSGRTAAAPRPLGRGL